MNKKRLLLSLASLFILTGCTISKRNSPTTSNSTSQLEQDAKIQQIYDLYKAAGGTLSYEEWLATIKGEQGAPGKDGQDGKDGVDGSAILSGTGAPSFSLGKESDIYIDTSSWDLWKKTNTGWIKIGNLKGEKGDAGSQGPTGPIGPQGQPGSDGSTVLSGNGQPANQLGKNGDVYIDLSTGDYYQKENNAWTLKGNIKGPQGEQGVSIVSSYINENGDLIVVFSNGQELNVGHIKDVNSYTVSFHVDDEIVATRVVSSGSTVSRPTLEETAGYTINDWYYLDGETHESWKFFGYVITKDTDLYADFEYNSYQINFVDNTFNHSIDALDVLYDKAFTFPIVSQTGYSIIRWEDEDGNAYSDEGTYRLTHDLTLYAIWAANTYTITLNDRGPSCPETVTVTYDSPYELPTPEKEGYVFTGWYKDNNERISGASIWTRTDISSLTAHWTNVSMTFTFDCGDGSCETESMVILYGESYQLPYPTPSSDDYLFVGWTLDGTLIPLEGTWTYSAVGKVLYAKWERYAELPSVNKEKTIIYYGMFPQTIVTDADLISSLNALQNSDEDKYLFAGNYYSPYCNENGITPTTQPKPALIAGDTYWYLWEPISWDVTSQGDNSFSVRTTKLLECRVYNSTGNVSSFSSSDLYYWLNNDFIDSKHFDDTTYFEATYFDASICINSAKGSSKITDWAWAHGARCDSDGVGTYWTTKQSGNVLDSYKVYTVHGGSYSDYPEWQSKAGVCVRPVAKIACIGF